MVDFFPAGNKIPKDVGWTAALAIGIVQGIAVFPGISRSGITIALCLLLGFNKKFAVKYSFLAAVPTVVGAAVLELSQNGGKGLSPEIIGTYGISALAAGIVGYFCIKMMLNLVRKKKICLFCSVLVFWQVLQQWFVILYYEGRDDGWRQPEKITGIKKVQNQEKENSLRK